MGDQEKQVKPPLIGEEVIPESLRLHSTIPTQTAAKMARYQKFQPKNAVSRMGAISFDITTGDQKYMDISTAVLHVECQIRDSRSDVIPLQRPRAGGGEEFHPLGKVLPVNGMGYTLFNNVKVALNNVPIDSGSVLYPYRGDFETRLFNDGNVKDGSSLLMGFDEEVVPFEDVRDVVANFPWQEWGKGTETPMDCLILLSTDDTNEAAKVRVYFSLRLFSQKFLTKTSGCHQKLSYSYLWNRTSRLFPS